MTTTVKKWGNSQGLRLPKALLEEAGITLGAEVEVTTDGQTISVRPARRSRRPGKYTLDDIIADMPDDPEGGELDWGPPVGKEVW